MTLMHSKIDIGYNRIDVDRIPSRNPYSFFIFVGTLLLMGVVLIVTRMIYLVLKILLIEENTKMRIVGLNEIVKMFQQEAEFRAQAREKLEHVIECFNKDRCESFQDCIIWARLRLEDIFSYRVKQLTCIFPEDATTDNGALFWTAPKVAGFPDHSYREPLDVSKNFTLDLISSLLLDIRKFFTFELFYLGGDVVPTVCWSSNPQVKQWLQD